MPEVITKPSTSSKAKKTSEEKDISGQKIKMFQIT